MSILTTYPMLEPLLKSFSISDLDEIKVKHLKPGEYLLKKNQVDSSLYIIIEGLCDVIRTLDTGVDLCNYKLSSLDLVGLYGLLLPKTPEIRQAAVIAKTNVTVVCIPKIIVIHYLSADPTFTLNVSQRIIRRLKETMDLTFNCSTHSLKLNVVTYLIHAYSTFLKVYPEGYAYYVKINEKRETISHFIGVEIRSINRTLKVLKEAQLITINNGKIHIDRTQYNELITLREQLLHSN